MPGGPLRSNALGITVTASKPREGSAHSSEASDINDDDESLGDLIEAANRLVAKRRAKELQATQSGSVASEAARLERAESPLFYPSDDEAEMTVVRNAPRSNSNSPLHEPRQEVKREPTPLVQVPNYDALVDDRRILVTPGREDDSDAEDFDPFDDGENQVRSAF